MYYKTALNLAIEKGNIEIVKLLLSNTNEIDINSESIYLKEYAKHKEYKKQTGIELAIEKNDIEIIRNLNDYKKFQETFRILSKIRSKLKRKIKNDMSQYIKDNFVINSINNKIKLANIRYDNCIQIYIPPSIHKIDCVIFKICRPLKTLKLPPSVIEIHTSAFDKCSGLRMIIIPFSVSLIYDFSSYKCLSSTKTSTPPSIDEVAIGILCKFSSLNQISILESITLNKNFAFKKCSSLKQISIPTKLTLNEDIHSVNECSSLNLFLNTRCIALNWSLSLDKLSQAVATTFTIKFLPNNFITTYNKDFLIEFLKIIQNQQNFYTNKYQDMIVNGINKYIKEDKLLNLLFLVFHKIMTKYQLKLNTKNETPAKFIDFLFKRLGRFVKKASVLFDHFDFSKSNGKVKH